MISLTQATSFFPTSLNDIYDVHNSRMQQNAPVHRYLLGFPLVLTNSTAER